LLYKLIKELIQQMNKKDSKKVLYLKRVLSYKPFRIYHIIWINPNYIY